jgi:hypothetical protein
MAVSMKNGLLDSAVTAHGGLERWEDIESVRLEASITGGVWHLKGRPDVLKEVVITATTGQERLTMDFPGQDKRSIFEPGRIVMETAAGEMVEARDDPVAHFAGQSAETPWDDIDVAYFSGEALWTYLTAPFLFTYPGFNFSEEPEPWLEDGEEWRRLRVEFPDSVASHTREQTFYFGADGLLRRHDYTVDILGGTAGANYALDLRDVGGIIVPTKRRIYGYQGDHEVVRDPVLVAIDIGEIEFASRADARTGVSAVAG